MTLDPRKEVAESRCWVVKIGSALLTNEGAGLDREAICRWSQEISHLREMKKSFVLISSGAVAEGICRLGLKSRPQEIYKLQAAAAVGQMGLIEVYESCFRTYGIKTAQVLLTHDDLSNRQRYLNARSTLRTLLSWGVIPIINENDTVAVDEIRFGDNDTLAALVTNLVEADLLVILTDQAGLYSEDPRQNPQATLISQVHAGDPQLEKIAGAGTGLLGRGGMLTKVRAAARAARSGAATIVVGGRQPHVLTRLAEAEPLGTLFLPQQAPLAARKQWLAGHLRTRGWLTLDDGAVDVVQKSGKSLLPIGVTGVEGSFERGELVVCQDKNGKEIARGLINYNTAECQKICGKPSSQIHQLLGYADEPELIHRDNLVLF